MWPSVTKVPKPADIPPCPHCGAARRFEFQVSATRKDHVEEVVTTDWNVVVFLSDDQLPCDFAVGGLVTKVWGTLL